MTGLKRSRTILIIIALAVAAALLTSCGKSEFGVTENTGKLITITAKKAARDAFFMLGSLEVGDGEQIAVRSNLTKGEIFVEIIAAPENQSIDELPDMDGEAILSGKLKTTDSVSCTAPAGSYMVRATCLEKATGTVQITAEPVSEETAAEETEKDL